MRVLICYDVATTGSAGARRLRKIAEACRDCGVRVQYSLFECLLPERDWVVLRARLLGLFKSEEDSLRFYFVNEDSHKKTEHHGVRPPVDVTAPFVI